MLSKLFPKVNGDEPSEDTPLRPIGETDDNRKVFRDFTSIKNISDAIEHKQRKSMYFYARDACHLQHDPDTPYYVGLAAEIFGLEHEADREKNTMNLKFGRYMGVHR